MHVTNGDRHTFSGSSSRSLVADYSRFRIVKEDVYGRGYALSYDMIKKIFTFPSSNIRLLLKTNSSHLWQPCIFQPGVDQGPIPDFSLDLEVVTSQI